MLKKEPKKTNEEKPLKKKKTETCPQLKKQQQKTNRA